MMVKEIAENGDVSMRYGLIEYLDDKATSYCFTTNPKTFDEFLDKLLCGANSTETMLLKGGTSNHYMVEHLHDFLLQQLFTFV